MKDVRRLTLMDLVREEYLLEAEPPELAALIPGEPVRPAAAGSRPLRRLWVAAAAVCLTVGLGFGLLTALTRGGVIPKDSMAFMEHFPALQAFLWPDEEEDTTESETETDPAQDTETEAESESDVESESETHDGSSSEGEETTAPPPLCEDGHSLELRLDRAATCYAVSRLQTVCRVCGYEENQYGEERLPHSYAEGVCTVCGLLEGAIEATDAEPMFGEDGTVMGKVLNTGFPEGPSTGGEILLPNVCFMEEYGLVPVCYVDAGIGFRFKPSRVVVPEGHTTIGSLANGNLTEVVLPSTLRHITWGCFEDSTALRSVVLPEGLLSIKQYAFKGCTSLTELSIPDSVTEIRDFAFEGCAALALDALPASLTLLGEGAFKECASITVSAIPGGVTAIPRDTFRECVSIPSMAVPDTVQSIGDAAFYRCAAMTSVTLPAGLTELSISVLANCSSLTELELPEKLAHLRDFALAGTGLVTVRVPDTVVDLGMWVFRNSPRLAEVVFEGAGTRLGDGCFSSCTALERVALPEKLTALPAHCFEGCIALRELAIPDSIRSLEGQTFTGCTALEKVQLPASLQSFHWQTFENCPSLTALTMTKAGITYSVKGNGLVRNANKTLDFAIPTTVIPTDGSVTAIGAYAFYGMPVEEVTVPEGVTLINRLAFNECKRLTTLHLPSTLTTVGKWMLVGCTSLQTVTYNGTSSAWKSLISSTDIDKDSLHYDVICTDGTLRADGSFTPHSP